LPEQQTIVASYPQTKMKKAGSRGFIYEICRNRLYYLMALPGILFFLIFCYLPMPGIIIAFKDYNFADGIFGSRWVGFKNFEFFFRSEYAWKTTFNTLFINANYIFWGTLTAILFALILNEIRITAFKKLYQNLMFLPYFLSSVVVANFVYIMLSDKYGLINSIIKGLGGSPVEWYQNAGYWVPILVVVNIWKGTGYSVIVYLATIAGIDEEMYEAAYLDGATRFKMIRYITLPCLIPTVIILTLLAVGRIFYGDFGTIYSIIGDQGQLFPTTEVIDTYVFKAVSKLGELCMPAAVGLYQSVCGFILVLGSNLLVKKINNERSLF
jgi:putative aldouronate transport system permease protein